MKKLTPILGLLFICLTVHAQEYSPNEASYCSSLGSMMSVKKETNSQVAISLFKNGTSFILRGAVGTITQGDAQDINEIHALAQSRNLIQADSKLTNFKSFGISTLLSEESTIRASHTLKEISVSSADTIAVLESNGTTVFVGSKNLCALITY